MISGFQHVGIGVRDMERSYDFYKRYMGFTLKLNDHQRFEKEMKYIIGDLVEMRILMAMNAAGGGALELVQHTSTPCREPAKPIEWGDIGVLEVGFKAFRLEELHASLTAQGVNFITPVRTMKLSKGGSIRYVYLRDPDGLLIQLVEEQGGRRPMVGGVVHAAIGVSDLETACDFYSRIAGFSTVLHMSDETSGMDEITGGKRTRMAILKQPSGLPANLPMIESGSVKLIQTPDYHGKSIYDGRRWGDLGCMEIAIDVTGLRDVYNGMLAAGAKDYCPPTRIDMGSGSIGSFAYVNDPDGNILEMVDVEKIMFMPPSIFKNIIIWPIKAAASLGLI